jgi:Ca2+-binding RTX toxin-like protein
LAFTNLGGTPETIQGTSGVDTLFELDSSTGLFVEGLGGNDNITFSPFGNQLKDSTVYGNAGNDIITVSITNGSASAVNSLIQGAAGNDTILVQNVVSSSTMRGGAGADTLTVSNAVSSVINGNKGGDTIRINGGTYNQSNVYGGADNDSMTITASTILSNGTINGNKGNDTIVDYGTGITSLSAATVFGGAGQDVITLNGGGTGLFISGDLGNDQLTSGAGADTVLGGAGVDTIVVGAGNDSVVGGGGADTITLAGGTNRVNFASGEGVVATASTTATHTTLGMTATFANGIESVTAFVSGTDDFNFGFSTGVAALTLTEGLSTATAILTTGTMFFLRGTLTGNTFTTTSLNGGAVTSGLLIAGNNNTLANTLTSQTQVLFSDVANLAAGDIV